MINTKNVFKKLLGLSLSAIIAVTSLGGTAAFASDGRLSDKSINDIVKYRATDTGFFANNANAVSRDDDALKIQSGLDGKGDVIQDTQPVTRAFTLDKSGDVLGSFSFDIKAGENNTNKHSLLFAFRNPDDPGSNIKPVFFIIGEDGFLGSRANPEWQYTPRDIAQQYTKGQYYKIGVVFNKDYTYDICVDGEKIGTGVISAEDQKAKLDVMTKIDFMIAVHDETKDVENRATFYMKDIMWQVGGGALVAETEKSEYVSGDTAAVKFSAPIMNKGEVSKVKLYESATGAKQSVAAAFDGDNVNVTLPNNLKSGREYRIELPEFKDCLGNTLTNDNVYFNVAASSSVRDIIDEYEGFEAMPSGDYTKPAGWYLQQRSNGQILAFSRAVDDEQYGKSLEIGKISATPTSGDAGWSGGGLYYPLAKKYSDGTVTISYDIKPQQYTFTDYRNQTQNVQKSFEFVAYNEALPEEGIKWFATDPTMINKPAYAKVLSGVMGTALGCPNTNINVGNSVGKSTYENNWEKAKVFDEGVLSEKWYHIDMKLDFDNGLYTYYVDGEQKFSSSTLLNEIGLNTGIAAIGMSITNYTNVTSQRIDNIKVSHSTNKALGEETELLNENFNAYTETNNILNNGTAYLPSGWSHANLWGNQVATVLKPYADTERGTSLEMGLQIAEKESYVYNDNERWNNPELYHALDQKYTSGILTMEYDVNPATLIDVNDTRLDKIKGSWYDADTAITSFNMTLYSEVYTGNQTAQNTNDNQIKAANAKRIFGIQNKNLSVYKDNTGSTSAPKGVYGAAYAKAATEGQWYRVRHIIDIDNDVIETYIGTTENDLALAGITKLSYFGLEGGIGGIGFGMNAYSFLGKTYLDNISVKYTPFKSSKGISAVRFSDYSGIAYGSASETTTLADTIAISFTDTPDVSNADISLYETANPTKTIGYTGALSETADNVYIMNLNEFLTANTEYTLKVDGVTCGGEAIEAYTHKITAEKNGELVIEPMKISVNGSVKSDGENYATETLKSGDAVETSVIIINTTGTKHEWAFSSGVYKNKMLNKFDYRMISLDGTSADGKYAKAVCTFNIDDETVKDLTKIRAYLWNGMTAMQPQSASCDLICGAAE